MYRQRTLTRLLTSATAAMIALTACALYLIDQGTLASALGGSRIWPMVLASSCATLLVMSVLQDELQRLCHTLAEREAQAQIDAKTDPLTGFGNRKFLFDELERRLQDPEASKTALLLVDLDNFKRVNDTRGHHVGDELIRAVAARLRSALPAASLVRLGGDEFALLIQADADKDIEDNCQRLLDSFGEPFAADDEECLASGSVGAAILRQGLTPSDVLRRADMAMYSAKKERCGFRVFDRTMSEAADRKNLLAKDLRNAIRSGESLSANFQGIYSRAGELVSIETLLRWEHPKLGHIPPPEIVAVAEEIRLINDLALTVASHACRAAQACPDTAVAVNVSHVQLLDDRFRGRLEEMVCQRGIPPDRIHLEVREDDFVEHAGEMKDALEALTRAGFSIAVDDFGSSTSSLAHLRKLGVSLLKLDPKVLRNARELASIAVMRAKVQLGQALGMRVVCEGIADEADRTAALQSGCDMLQGYLLGEPQELSSFIQSIAKRTAA